MLPATGPRRKINWGTLALIVLLHVAAIFGLARAFAPDFTTQAIRQATSLVTVTVRTREPEPEPLPEPAPTPEPAAVPDEGAAAPEAPRAIPKEVAAPEPAIPISRASPVPPVASTGSENASGAADQGTGTGGGGEGEGTGSGNAGSGAGSGGIARPLEKTAGNISDARDYPRSGRAARKGQDVVIELSVGTDGRVTGCRVTDPSPDPEADAITCRLAIERFRFRPALDAAGNPIPGRFLWRQQWF
ncbi:TonB family protein [Altericroceibacterium xinjiangense]|uniref:TonB family protein n=1 Tax=Altericroceibacterium xinjiangense TaxID=762261 RepID=UPI000F7DA257|nr:TonB family protein [Altericroceibacterium xinjiangense]